MRSAKTLREDPAWPDLLAEAEAAVERGSGWGRYGISYEDVEFRSEHEASQPPPDTPDDDTPLAIRETIASRKDAIARAGRRADARDHLGRHWRRTVVQATQVEMKEKRSPRRSAFTPPAARRWRELGPERQALFLGNVWCVSCGAETTME